MQSKTLATDPLDDGADVDETLLKLPPLPANVLVVARHLQSQIDALSARVEVLKTP